MSTHGERNTSHIKVLYVVLKEEVRQDDEGGGATETERELPRVPCSNAKSINTFDLPLPVSL